MFYFLALSALSVVFIFNMMLTNYTLKEQDISIAKNQLISKITIDYKNNFDIVDSNTSNQFMGYTDLQTYCKDNSIRCEDLTGKWRWTIQTFEEPLFYYKVIRVYDGKNSVLFSISGKPIWLDYIRNRML